MLSFRFLVEKAELLTSARTYCLTGRMVEGSVTHNTLAVADVDGESLPVKIKTVAFVDPAKVDAERMTLTIEQPDYDIRLLEGKELVKSYGL